MARYSIKKKERKLRFSRNISASKKITNDNKRKMNISENDLVSITNRTNNTNCSTYTQRSLDGPSHKKLTSFLQQATAGIDQDKNDYYQVIHNRFLLQLMKQTICILCKYVWDGEMSVTQREGLAALWDGMTNLLIVYVSGLYCSLLFTCRCSHQIKINTSIECPNTGRRDINVRSAIGKSILDTILTNSFILYVGASVCGIGHQGLAKLYAVLNLPPPVDDDHFFRTIKYVLTFFEEYKLKSMKNGIEEACSQADDRKLTISGDGSWQKRGFSSLHGVAAIMSNCPEAKVN